MANFSSALLNFGKRAGSQTLVNTVSYAAGQAASVALAPEVQPLANDAWKLAPSMPISPADLAEMVVQSIRTRDDAAEEASETGINGSRFDDLVALSGNPPGPQEILALWDRQAITEEQATHGLRQSRLKPEWIETYKVLSRNLLTAETLAEMVVQGIIPEDVATKGAAMVSIDAEDFHHMVLLAGSPPGPQEALSMWNRGIIQEADIDKALLQSRLKPEWVDQFKQLRAYLLPPALAAELVLKQRIPMEQGLAIARKNGVTDADFALMADVNGRPIGIGQALTLARRGEFNRTQFEEVVARSDVRTEYADNLWNLKRVIPRFTTIDSLVAHGELTTERATGMIVDLGYDKDIAAAMVSAAKKGKTATTRHLSASMIDTLYDSGLESKQWAMDALVALGYDEEEAASHLMMLDARRLLGALTAELNVVHRAYTGHKYDRDAATNNLDAMGVDPAIRNQLLDTWSHERDANVAVLTPAQIGQALKHGIITVADAISRWMTHGYSGDDASVLAELAGQAPPGTSPTAP